MKNLKLLRNIDTFYKLAQAKEDDKKDIEEIKVAYFDVWEAVLSPSSPAGQGKIQEVFVKEPIFKKRGPNSNVPVCIVESTEAQSGFLPIYEPSFIFRFGNFEEQPYKSDQDQIDYATQLLLKYTTYTVDIRQFEIEKISESNVRMKINNSSYNSCVAVFYRPKD